MEDWDLEERIRARDELLRARRAEKKRKQERKRKMQIIALLAIIAGLLCLLLFLGIRGIIRHVKGRSLASQELSAAELSTESIDPLPTDSPSPSPSSDASDSSEEKSDFGENALARSGVSLFPGYRLNFDTSPQPFVEEGIYSTHGILIDAENGNIIRSTDGASRIYPASMTKIMTVLTAAEHIRPEQLDDRVTITIEETDFVFRNDLSAVNFDLGESVTVRDLFYGTILPSGGDAALALAKYVAGSEEDFVLLMNDTVSALGLSDTTHFTNCVGLFNEENYSTCADIAVILKAALENELCYEALHAHTYTTSSTAEHPDGIPISNWFLRRIEDHYKTGEVLCAKTGFVVESRNCAASFALTDEGHPYLCVTADGGSSWQAIFDHVAAYTNYTD